MERIFNAKDLIKQMRSMMKNIFQKYIFLYIAFRICIRSPTLIFVYFLYVFKEWHCNGMIRRIFNKQKNIFKTECKGKDIVS